jgi:hypothetical protein
MIHKIVKYVNEDGFVFTFEPIEDTIKIVNHRNKDGKAGFMAKYLIQDMDVQDPCEMDEGMGNFYHWKDMGREELVKYCEALAYDIDTHEPNGEKENPDAVKIDKYEHSQIYYSVAGEGTQCRWDTSHAWAVWLPNACLLDDLKRFKTASSRRKRCIELARQACTTINQWQNGDVYCLVKETYSKDKAYIDHDTVGGYYGYNEAVKALETEI